jgi:hypothetical protein
MERVGAGRAGRGDDRPDIEEVHRGRAVRGRLDDIDAQARGGPTDPPGDLATIGDEQAANVAVRCLLATGCRRSSWRWLRRRALERV